MKEDHLRTTSYHLTPVIENQSIETQKPRKHIVSEQIQLEGIELSSLEGPFFEHQYEATIRHANNVQIQTDTPPLSMVGLSGIASGGSSTFIKSTLLLVGSGAIALETQTEESTTESTTESGVAIEPEKITTIEEIENSGANNKNVKETWLNISNTKKSQSELKGSKHFKTDEILKIIEENCPEKYTHLSNGKKDYYLQEILDIASSRNYIENDQLDYFISARETVIKIKHDENTYDYPSQSIDRYQYHNPNQHHYPNQLGGTQDSHPFNDQSVKSDNFPNDIY